MKYHEPEVIAAMKASFTDRADWVATLYDRRDNAEPFFTDSMYRSVQRNGRHSPDGWKPAFDTVERITGGKPVVEWAMEGLEKALDASPSPLGISRYELFSELARHRGCMNPAVARFDLSSSAYTGNLFMEGSELRSPFGLSPKLTVTVYKDGMVTYAMEALASAWAADVSFWTLYAMSACDHDWKTISETASWAKMECRKCGTSWEVDTGD